MAAGWHCISDQCQIFITTKQFAMCCLSVFMLSMSLSMFLFSLSSCVFIFSCITVEVIQQLRLYMYTCFVQLAH